MYIVVVLLQTVILPMISGALQLAVSGGDPAIVLGVWWAFWGVGTRLFVAGVSQLVNPGRTAQGILGIDDSSAELVVHELGYANLSMGLVAMLSAFAGSWGSSGRSRAPSFLASPACATSPGGARTVTRWWPPGQTCWSSSSCRQAQ